MRALISVWDKTGIDEFARGLVDLGYELVSSGGTAAFLEEHGLTVTRVEEVTAAPEMLGGRVKTLHPRIHAGILARRDLQEDVDTLAAHEIEPFDLVCVNLYPFASVAGRRGVDRGGGDRDDRRRRPVDAARRGEELRARRSRCAGPSSTSLVLDELRVDGTLSLEHAAHARHAGVRDHGRRTTRRSRPGSATSSSSRSSSRSASTRSPTSPYGENPHQRAAYYAEEGLRRHLLSRVEQLGGKELSYNNLADLEGARRVVREFALPAAVIVKHGNPCGVAVAGSIEEAYERALAADPVSAFGCVLVLNRPVGGALGARIAEHFVEVLLAPDFDADALAALRAKPALRLLCDRERRMETPGERDYKRVLGGLLVQERDVDVDDRQLMTRRRRQRHRGAVGRPAVRLARVQARQLERDRAREGPADDRHRRRPDEPRRRGADRVREGARARPRPGAARCSRATRSSRSPTGPQVALDAGVAALIQPGGSKRDDEVIAAVKAAGAAMILTGRRHFRH